MIDHNKIGSVLRNYHVLNMIEFACVCCLVAGGASPFLHRYNLSFINLFHLTVMKQVSVCIVTAKMFVCPVPYSTALHFQDFLCTFSITGAS